jgi:hypothetical protein
MSRERTRSTVDSMRGGPAGSRTRVVTSFAGWALRRERRGAIRALGRSRTCDLGLRRAALCPLSYEGMVRVPGADPGLPEGGGVTAHWTCRRPRRAWGDWSVPIRLPPGSQPGALPLSYSHHDHVACPRQDSNLRPLVCGTGALPTELHGRDPDGDLGHQGVEQAQRTGRETTSARTAAVDMRPSASTGTGGLTGRWAAHYPTPE